MGKNADELYYKGYVAGYRDGIRDAHNGVNTDPDNSIANIPLTGAAISTRARNCLTVAGCITV